MFPLRLVGSILVSSFPRVRGDVPGMGIPVYMASKFSPRARGCSLITEDLPYEDGVFPACAGMFPPTSCPTSFSSGFPRVRGDVPVGTWLSEGWENVFPACAGMFHGQSGHVVGMRCFPRVRGDVPTTALSSSATSSFSPRARGCSRVVEHINETVPVFPACAGMFLTAFGVGVFLDGFPRVRGDVPADSLHTRPQPEFSPRARGCSQLRNYQTTVRLVFPACAGMFRRRCRLRWRSGCFPRVRGDVPQVRSSDRWKMSFSPRARGCSCGAGQTGRHGRVFPACAGMFRVVTAWAEVSRRFPRVRGDVPPPHRLAGTARGFSPRARGCSVLAGNFSPFLASFPRVRGDVPR